MNAFIVFSALVAVAVASDSYESYHTGKGHVQKDSTGNTVELMGYDQNYDGLPDKLDTNRDGHPDAGYGYGHGYGHRYGHGYGHFNARHAYDSYGQTVPVMGKDQNNDGVSDFKDRNRDGKEDKHYGYGHGYGHGYGYGGYGRAGYGNAFYGFDHGYGRGYTSH